MKKTISFLCVLALLLSVASSVFAANPGTVFQGGDALAVTVLEEDLKDLTVNGDMTVDLNGHNIDGVTVLEGTLYIKDSATADYTVADGVYGKVTNVTGNVQAAEGYLQIGSSFHAVDLSIYAMTLRAAGVGVYYKSHFAADEVVAQQVESFGIALSVTGEPNAKNLSSCGYSAFTDFAAGKNANDARSTLLTGIMRENNTDYVNGRNAGMPIYGRAYIKTADGYYFGASVQRTLRQQVEAIDEIWEDLKPSQKSPVLAMLKTYEATMASWTIPNLQGVQTPGVDTEIEMPIDVTAENGIVTEEVTVTDEGIEITVPVGTELAEGVKNLTLTVTPKEETQTDLEITEDQKLIPMDVHVDGLAASDTVPVLITLKQCLKKGINDGNVQLYHVEQGQTVAMTLVDKPVNHNEFSYDPVTGDVVLAMASFSEVSVVNHTHNTYDGTSSTEFAGGSGTEADPYLIANAQDLAYFRDLVDGGKTFQGEYVKLNNNIQLSGDPAKVNFDPIGYGYECQKYMSNGRTFNGTFDGDNHSISGLYQNGWDLGDQYSYSMAGGGLFASVVDATIKNLKMDEANIVMECVDMGILVGYAQGNCTFENIGIYDSKIANYQRATGGVVGEVSPRRDANGKVIGESVHTFKNVEVGPTVVVGSLWGDFDAPVGGILGARWDDDNVTKVIMEDVDVACRLDVYNDVTAAYRWHAYRRAGMLIGNTDTPPADGRTAKVATAEFLTCRDVRVHWGDWVNYHYCQFTNDNNPGRNYPWVRVEEGENCSAYSNPRYGQPTDAAGNKVTNASHTHKAGDTCHLELPFAQLYGGGQGVYGATTHEGVTFSKPVYTITYVADMVVYEIDYVTDNSKDVPLKNTPGENMQWIDKEGNPVTKVEAGNTHAKVFYLDDKDKLIAHFTDINGIGIAHVEFKKGDKELEWVPEVPRIEGYYGKWESYDLEHATGSIVVKPVYTIEDKYVELYMSLKDLFKWLSEGKDVVMTQSLDGAQSNASSKQCAVITGSGITDKDARLNLNGYTLHYNFAANGNQDWKIFDIRGGSSLTVSGGIMHDGVLVMQLSDVHSSCKPVMFDLDPGAKLVLEKGTTIELWYSSNMSASQVSMFGMEGKQFALNQADYPYLEYTKTTKTIDGKVVNVKRVVVKETTVIVGK